VIYYLPIFPTVQFKPPTGLPSLKIPVHLAPLLLVRVPSLEGLPSTKSPEYFSPVSLVRRRQRNYMKKAGLMLCVLSCGGFAGLSLAQHLYPHINIMATGQYGKKGRYKNEGVIDPFIRPGEDLGKENKKDCGDLTGCCDLAKMVGTGLIVKARL
jgi:hypothetical protein